MHRFAILEQYDSKKLPCFGDPSPLPNASIRLGVSDRAITIGEADDQIQNISKVIGLVAKAADLVEAVIKTAAK